MGGDAKLERMILYVCSKPDLGATDEKSLFESYARYRRFKEASVKSQCYRPRMLNVRHPIVKQE